MNLPFFPAPYRLGAANLERFNALTLQPFPGSTLHALAFLGLLAVVAGCSSPNVNPPSPRANTGYVDFYTDSNQNLSWEVKRAGENTNDMRTVFSDYKTMPGNILRLATPAGNHCFQVWFMNLVTTGPETVIVEVANGKVTPVHVTLKPAASASVQSQSYEYRATARATRRVTRITMGDQQAFDIGLVAASPQDYQTKERVLYFSPASK